MAAARRGGRGPDRPRQRGPAEEEGTGGSSPVSPRSCRNGSRPQSGSPMALSLQPASTSAYHESQSASAGITQLGSAGCQMPAVCFWPQNTKCLIQEGLNAARTSPPESLAHGDVPMPPASLQSLSHVKYKDFIRCLPVHLSQYILGLLDQKSLKACAAVSRYWAFLVKEVERDHVCQGLVKEKILCLQGLRPRGTVSNYAKIVNVTIPQLNEEGRITEVKRRSCEGETKEKEEEEEGNLQAAYHDLQTDTIQLEERNVFCGSYNIRVLTDRSDQNRVIHYSGGDLVAIGSTDRKVRFFDTSAMREVPPLLSGHAGSIKALFLDEKKGFVFSASFDLSIRCWDIYSGACMKIFSGHCGTIICLDVHERRLVSGARDGMVKVWNLDSGVCLKTLKHNDVVCVVKMDGIHVVSGCDGGLVKVWLADTGALVKILEGHQGPVKCLSFDPWHLVTGSSDGYALGWSMVGDLKRCLTAFRHPKEVLSLEFLYLRVVSGCADGKIRIFSYLTGSCLKVLVASSRGEPVSFCVAGNRMVINAPSSLLMFQFEDVRWDYTLAADREMVRKEKQETCPWSRAPSHSQQMTCHIVGQKHRLALQMQAACKQWEHLLESTRTFHVPAQQQQELFIPGNQRPHAFALGRPVRACSARILAGADGTSEYGTPVCVPEHPDMTEAILQHNKKKDSYYPVSSYKFLLTVNMLRKSCKSSFVRSSTKPPIATGKAWEAPLHQQRRLEKRQIYVTPLQHKKDQTARLQHMRSRGDSLTMKRISTPFETKMLQLKLKNSLHGPTVSSSIPAPCIVRPKTRGSLLQEKKAHGGHGKVSPLPEEQGELSSPCTTSELIKSTHARMAQMKNETVYGGKKPFCAYSVQTDGGFRLLTGNQKEAHEATTIAQCQANQAKLLEDHQKACKKAWLRKTKGLPTDSFTKEGKIAAPELGLNTFI
ncbi:CMT1A duplicated region transcript 1 protein [Oxyura jamaicensis]|uniref:CMT1A duplicated region transcript 1 protein n=1 Tax=Oxyura jamaicensis TaxID=8884 RepID=UPI0015A52462|nr:CMT1A duplicated region transcript 1 protein [Oxyura jamaicensis]